MSSVPSVQPNAKRLLWAGSLGIFAAGMGAAVRGGILAGWGSEFDFSATQLGAIVGAGFTGFCFGIVIGGLICDRIGYGRLIAVAFVLHVLSACVTLPAAGAGSYTALYCGTLIFGCANGTLEAVANPLVATLFPQNRPHYLNILHASWPAGLVCGGVVGWVLGDRLHLGWRVQLATYLVPTVIYGLLFWRQHMPKSEASRRGLRLGEMLKDVGILGTLIVAALIGLFLKDALNLPASYVYAVSGSLLIIVAVITRGSIGSWLLFVLFVTQALVGTVELGTDSWIQNITGNLLTSEQGKILFVATSATMFALRFTVSFIERNLKLSPVGLLLGCALLACLGLHLTSSIVSFGGALIALILYAAGKAFFWPTMLGITSDRFPRTGAIAISIMSGIGMISAGLIGTPGLGYAKDRFAGEALQADAVLYAEYRAQQPSQFLLFRPAYGLDGHKLGQVQAHMADARAPHALLTQPSAPERAVYSASVTGDRKTLWVDAFIPAAMAAIYLLLLIYFKLIGGYRAMHIQS